MTPKELKKHSNPHVVIMHKNDEEGRLITASAHRNQVTDFIRDGWTVAPCYEGEIPISDPTDDRLRAHDRGDITLIEKPELRARAAKDPALRDHLLANAAIEESIRNPDPDKVAERIEEAKRNEGNRTKRRKKS